VFDFDPMKSASLHPKLTTVSSVFEERTVDDMRNLHDQIMTHGFDGAAARQKASDAEGQTHRRKPRLRQSSFVSTMDMIEAPFYGALGFVEGAFTPHVVNETGERNETTIERNVTECRINAIRFVNNLTYFAWYHELDYGIDRKILFGTDSMSSSYSFSFNCFYAMDEAVEIASTQTFMD